MKQHCYSFLVSLLALSLPTFLYAQTAEKYAETIQVQDLKAHLTFIADDVLEGRETGSRGLAVAAKYLQSQLMRIGIAPGNPKDNSYFQYYKVITSTLEEENILIGKENFSYQKDFFTFDLAKLPKEITGDWVFAGYGMAEENYNNLKGLDIKGKNVLVLGGSPKPSLESLRGQIREWNMRNYDLMLKGAKSIFMVLPDSVYDILNIYGKKKAVNMASPEDEVETPIFLTNTKMADAFLKSCKMDYKSMITKLSQSEKVPACNFAKLKWQYKVAKKSNEATAANVIGILEGTDKKDEYVAITAHYDHLGIVNGQICNGADDDGSGTVSLLEQAEAFAKAAAEGHRPSRSLLFIFHSGEEKGLWGSEYYTENPLYPLEKTVADLNIDMIGRIDPKYSKREDSVNYVYVIGADKLSSELHEINESVNKAHTNLTLDYTYNSESDPNQFYYRSDHYNFAKRGIPVIFYFTGTHEDYHKPTDDIEKIRFPKMVTINRLVFHTAWELVNREKRIVVDKK